MKVLFDKEKPLEDRISKLETVVSRLARRSKKVTSAIIPPVPISSYASGEDVKGDILKYMFTARGVIEKVILILDRKPSMGVIVNISISNDAGGSSKNYIVTNKSSIFGPNVEVFSSDKLSISINPIDKEKDVITEAWVAFTWVPHVSDSKIESCLIDGLEKSLSEMFEET